MKTKKMGRTGLKVSEICLGTMTFGMQCDEPTSFAIMDTAVEHGVDFFDTADGYPMGGTFATAGRTEEIVGKWLHGRRDKIVLATKCWVPMGKEPNNRGSRANISSMRSRRVCAVCRLITSICIRRIRPIRKRH